MAANKSYFKLDDVGQAGVTKERSRAEIERDLDETSAFVKARKLAAAQSEITSERSSSVAKKRSPKIWRVSKPS